MTYEHAQRMTEAMNRSSITGFCEPVSIDALLQTRDVPEEFYHQFSTRFHNPDPELTLANFGEFASAVFPGHENYFGEFGSYAEYTISDKDALDPFSPEEKDSLSTPLPRHETLKVHLDELETSITEAGLDITEEDKESLRAEYRKKIVLAIVIDNALEEGLTVLGAGGKHVFGIAKGENPGEHFMINSFRKEEDPETTILHTFGPLNLSQVVGIRGVDSESSAVDYFPAFEDEYTDDEPCFMLILYPPEA